ncbi:hypothetical protein H2198_000223 [Neophaeococcomyces mojaviensis]|uniref:Uncharacterized protein n=1 Tax=Neophaeococcomyces mojaviensis TaxID=3383035 RepID=A0ACC3AKY0_9EURO|nr:hypothetical protein H2198_000223 [Knufia sp. JES_112]
MFVGNRSKTKTTTGTDVTESLQSEEQPLLEQPQARTIHPRLHYSDYLKLGLVLLGDFLANVDGTFVLIVFNKIAGQFDRASYGPWLLVAETLAFCITSPIYGTLGDRFGSRRILLSTFAIFVVGCCICGTGTSFWQVVAGRVISGSAAAGLTSLAAVVICENATATEAGVLRSYASIFSVLGRTAGGPLGGLITDWIGWRAAFFLEAALATVCGVGLGLLFEAPAISEEPEDDHNHSKDARFDFLGISCLGLTLTGFVVALDRVDRVSGPKDLILIASCVTFVVFGLATIFVEIKAKEHAFLPLDLLKSGLGSQMLFVLLLMFAQFSMVANVPTYFTRVMDASTTKISLASILMPAGNILGSFISGQIIRRTKAWKLVCSIGLVLCFVGYLLLAFLWTGPLTIPRWFFVMPASFGVGCVNTAQFVALAASGMKERTATAISMFFLAQNLGMMSAVSGSSSISRLVFKDRMRMRLQDTPRCSKVRAAMMAYRG